VTLASPLEELLTKYFLQDVKGKLCSKFGEDRSKTGLTILAAVAGWTDTGRTDGWTDALKWIYILSNVLDRQLNGSGISTDECDHVVVGRTTVRRIELHRFHRAQAIYSVCQKSDTLLVSEFFYPC